MSDNNIKNRFQCCDIGPGLLAEMKAAAEGETSSGASKGSMQNQGVLSKPLMAETLKNAWYLPVLSFVFYFLGGIFPIIVDLAFGESLNEPLVVDYIGQHLRNYNIIYSVLLFLVPLIAAILVMNYLHRPARTMAMLAYPLSRTKIFWSQVFSGWLMCVAPIVLMTLCYLPFMRYAPEHAPSVFTWFCSSVAILTYYYGMYILAGALTGNSVMQLLVSGLFFSIVPIALWLTAVYCESFLYGFTAMPESLVNVMTQSNPTFATIFLGISQNPKKNLIIYFILGIFTILLAHYGVKHARLEKSGDSMYYRVVEELITWLVVFIGMCVFGIFFSGMWETFPMLLAGVVIGTLVTFFITKIVINKSIDIFNRSNLKSLVCFTLLAMVFLGLTVFDVAGYARKVPDKEDVVRISSDIIYGYDDVNYNFDGTINLDFTSEDTIEKVLALHEYIVAEELYKSIPRLGTGEMITSETVINNHGIPTVSGNEYLRFTYLLSNGHTMERTFDVPLTEEVASLIHEIVTSEEYLADRDPKELLPVEKLDYVYINFDNFDYEKGDENETHFFDLLFRDEETLTTLIETLSKDHYAKGYLVLEESLGETTLDNFHSVSISCEFYFKPEDQTEASIDSSLNNTFYVPFTPQYRNTLTLLKELCIQEGTEDSLYFASFLDEMGF